MFRAVGSANYGNYSSAPEPAIFGGNTTFQETSLGSRFAALSARTTGEEGEHPAGRGPGRGGRGGRGEGRGARGRETGGRGRSGPPAHPHSASHPHEERDDVHAERHEIGGPPARGRGGRGRGRGDNQAQDGPEAPGRGRGRGRGFDLGEGPVVTEGPSGPGRGRGRGRGPMHEGDGPEGREPGRGRGRGRGGRGGPDSDLSPAAASEDGQGPAGRGRGGRGRGREREPADNPVTQAVAAVVDAVASLLG
jgi:hypothetical protein